MSKTFKRMIGLMMVICILASSGISALAAEENNGRHFSSLGSLADDEGERYSGAGYIAPASINPRSSTLFSISARGVTGLLTSYFSAGKNFKRINLSGDTIEIDGRFSFSNTSATAYDTKIGVCYYVEDDDEFITDDYAWSCYFDNGENEHGEILVSELYYSATYYAFVNNRYYSSAGSITGDATYSVS